MIARLLICSSSETLRCNLKGYRTNHPDILYFKAGEKLGIAEARKIKDHFFLKPYSAKGRTVILENAEVLTTEAQNALLKTIEELPEEATLILGANSSANFLPTILSRCQIEYLPGPKTEVDISDVEKLLNSSIEERFAYVEKLKDKDEFLRTLVWYFHQDVPKNTDFLKELLQAEKWAKQNVNMRGILEYLMLVMPSKIW